MIAVGALNEFLSEAIKDDPVDIFSLDYFKLIEPEKWRRTARARWSADNERIASASN
jgi:hypothetical protein